MPHAGTVFPRLPFLPEKYTHLQPLLLAAVGVATLVYGLARDDSGFVVIGAVAIAGAALGLVSQRIAGSETAKDEENPARD